VTHNIHPKKKDWPPLAEMGFEDAPVKCTFYNCSCTYSII
jgi:hypothetical protein